MKIKLLMVAVIVAGLTGCMSTAPGYSWYHPDGGEFLFAYDKTACESHVTGLGRSLGTDTQGPFFNCMHNRGYVLVDDQGRVHAPIAATFSETVQSAAAQ